jgi:hypothetical protein
MTLLLVLRTGVATLGGEPEAVFRRGDLNLNGKLDAVDAHLVLRYIFDPFPPAWPAAFYPSWRPCMDAADADDDGRLSIADALHVLRAVFAGGPPPPAPFPHCGPDPTPDSLDCVAYPDCSVTEVILREAKGAFFVIQVSASMNAYMTSAKRMIDYGLALLSPEAHFAIVFFGREASVFPGPGQAALADEETKARAGEFVEIQKGSWDKDNCPLEGLGAALACLRASPGEPNVMFYVGDGSWPCDPDEAAYLRRTIEVVTRENAGRARIDTVSFGGAGTLGVQFLEELARRNGGSYERIVR